MLKSLCDILNDAFREVRGRSPKRFLETVDAYAGAVAPTAGLAGVGLGPSPTGSSSTTRRATVPPRSRSMPTGSPRAPRATTSSP